MLNKSNIPALDVLHMWAACTMKFFHTNIILLVHCGPPYLNVCLSLISTVWILKHGSEGQVLPFPKRLSKTALLEGLREVCQPSRR